MLLYFTMSFCYFKSAVVETVDDDINEHSLRAHVRLNKYLNINDIFSRKNNVTRQNYFAITRKSQYGALYHPKIANIFMFNIKGKSFKKLYNVVLCNFLTFRTFSTSLCRFHLNVKSLN